MHTYTYTTEVFIEDTDLGGVVYHSKYLNFMERARSSWLKHLGYPIQACLDQGLFFLVRFVQVDYLYPALVNDHLEIVTTLHALGKSSIEFHHIVHNAKQKDCVYCKGTVKIVCVDTQNRPQRVPDFIRELSNGR